MNTKRINSFKKELIKVLPKFPNDKNTKDPLEQMHLTDLFIAFLSWKVRLITPRIRELKINKFVDKDDERYKQIIASNEFKTLKEKIEDGEDINDYLSLKAHQKGYSPNAKDENTWDDKDFLLNVMNYYHFHLVPYDKNSNQSTRTDELIFAKVDKSIFEIIGVFDHRIFENSNDESLNEERERLYKVWNSILTKDMPDGSIYIPTNITTSGHNEQVVSYVMECVRIINELEPKIESLEFLEKLYNDNNIPKNPKLRWYFHGTDCGLIDRDNTFFKFMDGKN
jgi:hypothetical protein